MPSGKVKWFDADKGFGFLSQEEGPDVYVHADAVPAGTTLKQGARVEFGIAQGRRGDQALQVKVLEAPASVTRNQSHARRKKPEEMAPIVEDLIRLLDDVGESYRRGRHPGPAPPSRRRCCCARLPTSSSCSRAGPALRRVVRRPPPSPGRRRAGGNVLVGPNSGRSSHFPGRPGDVTPPARRPANRVRRGRRRRGAALERPAG